AFAHEPLVEADAPVHLLRAVIGHDEHEGVRRTEGEHLAQLRVDVPIVIPDRVRELVPRLVLGCCGSMWLQKPWWVRSTPSSTSMKKSHGRVRRRCFASRRCLFVFAYTRRRSPALSAVRKSSTSSW